MKLRTVLMIILWLVLYFVGTALEGIFNPSPRNPSFVIYREVYRQPESSGDLATLLTLLITEVRDTQGVVVMPGQPWTVISPGDTVTLQLGMTVNGHVASFSIADPTSGHTISTTYPTEKGSDVVASAPLSLLVPSDTPARDTVQVPWQAEAYVIRKVETTIGNNVVTGWFDLVKAIPVSETLEVPLASPETRKAWLQTGVNLPTSRFLRFFGLAFLLTALIVIIRKHFIPLVSLFVLFAGNATMYILDTASRGQPATGFLVLALIVVAGTVALTSGQVHRFHLPAIRQLLFPSG
jgi:hypothetical protein